MDKIRLLIVSDQASTRKGLSSIFSNEDIFEVLGACSLDVTIDKAIAFQPDVVLVDIPDNLLKYGEKFREIKGGCPCSVLLAVVKDEWVENLSYVLENGLDGCVPRGIRRGSLMKTVELACRTGLFCLPGSFKKAFSCSQLNRPININQSMKNLPAHIDPLTKREMEVLQLMAKNLSNREIAEKLFISEPTVKSHVRSILRKLGQSNRAQAILYSYKVGLIKENESDNKL